DAIEYSVEECADARMEDLGIVLPPLDRLLKHGDRLAVDSNKIMVAEVEVDFLEVGFVIGLHLRRVDDHVNERAVVVHLRALVVMEDVLDREEMKPELALQQIQIGIGWLLDVKPEHILTIR